MIRIEVQGLAEVQTMLQQLRVEKIPTAARNAINDTAFGLKAHVQNLIKSSFKNPHPSTIKNVFVVKANKENLAARVRFDQLYKTGVDEYMLANIEGGSRAMKPSEQRLNRYYVPGIGAKMNAYGNMTGGQVTQVLSRLGRFGDVAGYDMNETAKSKRLRSGTSKGTEYFIVTQPKGGLKPGVYQRTEKRGGYTAVGTQRATRGRTGAFQKTEVGKVIKARGAVPVMVFTKGKPKYKVKFPFFKSSTEYVNKALVGNFNKEIQYHLSHGGGR